MQLYAGTSTDFIADTTSHRIAEKLKAAFFGHFRFHPPDSEIRSWQNSLDAMCSVMREAPLDDHGILLEYLAVRKLRQERGSGAEPPGVTGTIDQATPQF